MTNKGGGETGCMAEDFSIRRGILRIGEGATEYRYSVGEDTLSLTVSKAVSKEDVGNTLHFRRKGPSII